MLDKSNCLPNFKLKKSKKEIILHLNSNEQKRKCRYATTADKNYAVQIDRQRVHITADCYELDVKLYQLIKVEGAMCKEYPLKVETNTAKRNRSWLV